MNESSKSNDTLEEPGLKWPGLDLIFAYQPNHGAYMVAIVVAIIAVLITIVNNKVAICIKIGKVIPSNIFYILFGILCASIEFFIKSYKVIIPGGVFITFIIGI